MGHVVALDPTSTVRCGLKLQLTWQRVDARPALCLDLELVCEGTRSSGYRHNQNSSREHDLYPKINTTCLSSYSVETA
jgi:hypothetical protein